MCFFYFDTEEDIFKYVCVHISDFYRRLADNNTFQYRPLCHQIIHRMKIASEEGTSFRLKYNI